MPTAWAGHCHERNEKKGWDGMNSEHASGLLLFIVDAGSNEEALLS